VPSPQSPSATEPRSVATAATSVRQVPLTVKVRLMNWTEPSRPGAVTRMVFAVTLRLALALEPTASTAETVKVNCPSPSA